MLRTSATSCAIAVSELWPMSTVPQNSVQLPSAATCTTAIDVVGEIDALKPMAMPRPRRIFPVPRSNGAFQLMSSGALEAGLGAHVLDHGAGRLRTAVAQDVLAPEFDRVHADPARDQVGVALIGPYQLRDAEAAQRAGRRQVGVERVGVDLDVVYVVGTGRGETGFLRDARADV